MPFLKYIAKNEKIYILEYTAPPLMDEAAVLEDLFDRKLIRVLKSLFRDRAKQFYLQELADASKVPLATCSRILARLEGAGVIEVRKISRFKLYSVADTKRARFLSTLFKEDMKILHLFTSEARKIRGVDTIILHGKEQKDRANVLLIGNNIDPGEVKSLCASIREQHGFVVSPLSLTVEQYNQMSQMGLYGNNKKVLYDGSDAK
jgi:DNA-binding MarR family transcriptional regulator